jgi:hypothetical protein
LCLNQEGNETEFEQLQRQLQELIDQMVNMDPTIKFFPWLDRNQQTELDKSKVPNDMRSINIYFPRLQANRTGFTYGEMHISHSRRWEDIIFDLTEWLSNKGHGVYVQTLQCPVTTNLGWLLWSFRKIDIKTLENEIYAITKQKVQLRYQNISIGNGKSNDGTTVKALHIIVNQIEADKASNLFQQLYSFEAKAFPLGIVMRFIPHILKVSTRKNQKY